MYDILIMYAAECRIRTGEFYYSKGKKAAQELGGERWLDYPGMKKLFWD